MKLITTFVIASVLFSTNTLADNYAPREGRFIDRDSEGWWFYEDPISEEKPIKDEPPKKEKPKQVETVELPPEKPEVPKTAPPPAGPAPMSAEWFRENLQKYKDKAWDNPTPENVTTYYYLQSYMLDKSSMFADMAEQVVVTNPALDESTRRPLATFGSQAVDRQAKENKDTVLKNIASKYGLWFFYDSSTVYTTKQSNVLKMLEREHGYTIFPISLDGTPPPEGTFSSFNVDQGHAAKLGILTTPAVYMVDPETGKFALVGQGVMSRPDLHRRLLIVAQQNGFITEEQFKSAKPMLNAEYIVAESINEKELKAMAENSEDNFIPPEQFMKYIQSKMSTHGERN